MCTARSRPPAAVLLALLLFLPSTSSQWHCPDGWESVPAEDGTVRCYRVSAEAHSFTACQSEVCGAMDSTLACVRTEEENNRVHDLLVRESEKSPEKWGAWIGFHEGKAEGDWAWTSEECSSTFTRWHPGEPNDYCVDEDCTMMAPELWGRQWVDASCELDAYCLCEHGLHLSPEYTDDIIAALKSNSADYDACKEEDEAVGKIKRALNGWAFVRLLLLAAILASNVVILITVRRHLVGSRAGSPRARQSALVEQPLLPTTPYDTLPSQEAALVEEHQAGP